jgi:hypothetical protein
MTRQETLPTVESHPAEDILERYAIGSLRADLIPPVEEHLFCCAVCQLKLTETDEFVGVLRAAATEVLETSRLGRHSWTKVFSLRPIQWAGAAAVMLAVGFFAASDATKHTARQAPAVVLLQAFRGADSAAVVGAGQPALLIFDIPDKVAPADCRLEIVDLNGKKTQETGIALRNGRLEATASNLGAGDYWVRLYRRSDGELLGEYGLRAEKK